MRRGLAAAQRGRLAAQQLPLCKISSPCSLQKTRPTEAPAGRGMFGWAHYQLQRKPPRFPFLFCLLSRANKCF